MEEKKVRKNKKVLLTALILVLVFGGTTVGFAAGLGFFNNATIVQNNIDKLVQIVSRHKQNELDLQSKIDQNTNEQEQLKKQIEQLKSDLINKDKEKADAIDAKQKELDKKQAELDKKQREYDSLSQERDNLKQQSQTKDQTISSYEQEMQRLADYSTQKVNELGGE